MQPDPRTLLAILEIETPPIGFYDAPAREPFEPIAAPENCVFAHYPRWLAGESLLITEELVRCPGSGTWLCGLQTRTREQYIEFLGGVEGLKATPEIMGQWLDNHFPYRPQHPYLVLGPLQPDQFPYLKTVTFFVNPDQLAALAIGAEYHNADPAGHPIIAPFGSGCMQLAPLFDDLDKPQAIIGSLDIAMRRFLPADIIAFTVTVPMFRQLCALDEASFLHKAFWRRLQAARA